MDRIIKCKFCGQLTAKGYPIETSKGTFLAKIVRTTGSCAAALNGDTVLAYNIATGMVEDSVDKMGNNVRGGTLYHFECHNPDCLQNFDKVVL